MEYSKQKIVENLRRAGLRELADEAMRQLPDPVDLEDAEEWGMRYGVTRDTLVSLMGGSP